MEVDGFCWGMQYKYNERLKMLNHKLKAKCKTQRDFLAVYRFLIFCSQRTEQNQGLDPGFEFRGRGVWRTLHSQSWQVHSALVSTLIIKNGSLRCSMENLVSMFSEILNLQCPEPGGPKKEACSSILKLIKVPSPCLK